TAAPESGAGHRGVGAAMPDAAGLSVADLQCPSVHPPDGASRRRLQDEARASGEADTDPRSALHFNCSGKHTAFLTAARAIGAETSTYLSADHTVQIRVAEVIEAFASETPADVGVDGCGAPVFALSLNGLARAIGRVVSSGSSAEVGPPGDGAGAPADAWTDYTEQTRTLMDAVFADPW